MLQEPPVLIEARGDVIYVAGPADVSEVGHPAGDGHVAQVAPAVDQPRSGKQGRQEPQVQVVVGHLVGDAQGPGIQLAELLKVPLRHPPHGGTVQAADAGAGRLFDIEDARQRVEGLAAQSQLAGPENLRMAGQDLLDQRGSRARQPHDEHRPLAVEAEASNALEVSGRERRQQAIDKPRVVRGIVPPAALLRVRKTEGVALARMVRGLFKIAPGIEDLGQGSVESRALARHRVGTGQQLANHVLVGLGELAAQQRCELAICGRVVWIVPQRLAEAGLGFVEAAQLFQHSAQAAVSGSIVRLMPQSFAVACGRQLTVALLVQDRT